MLHNKFWQGFFALAPLITVFVAIIGYFIFLFSMFGQFSEFENLNNEPPAMLFAGIGTFVVLILITVLLSIASLVFYIVHAAQNPNLKENNLLLVWILLFVFASGIGQLIYWIMEIVNKRKSKKI